jgi:hypothetical protein
VALVAVHIYQLINYKEYIKAVGSQETIFIAALTLALMIVLIVPHIISKEQIERNVKQEIENYWKSNYQKKVDQFINKSEKDYAHTSRIIAYLLNQTEHYYWAMAWAGDSVVSYIKYFKGQHNVKGQHNDFQLNREYFNFSLYIMKKSFDIRIKGKFLENNMDLESYENIENKSLLKKLLFGPSEPLEPLKIDVILMKKIGDKIYNGEKIAQREKEISVVKNFKRVILRYIKWQYIIEIETQEHKLSNDIIDLIKKHLDTDFKKKFEDMVKKILKSFYYIDENNNEKVDEKQFIYDIVEKVELEEDREKVHKYLEKIIKTYTSSST